MKLNTIADKTTDLVLAIDRMTAVAQSFAEDYIDIPEEKMIGNITLRKDHFCNLYNALVYMIFDIRDAAAEIEAATVAAAREKKLPDVKKILADLAEEK